MISYDCDFLNLGSTLVGFDAHLVQIGFYVKKRIQTSENKMVKLVNGRNNGIQAFNAKDPRDTTPPLSRHICVKERHIHL